MDKVSQIIKRLGRFVSRYETRSALGRVFSQKIKGVECLIGTDGARLAYVPVPAGVDPEIYRDYDAPLCDRVIPNIEDMHRVVVRAKDLRCIAREGNRARPVEHKGGVLVLRAGLFMGSQEWGATVGVLDAKGTPAVWMDCETVAGAPIVGQRQQFVARYWKDALVGSGRADITIALASHEYSPIVLTWGAETHVIMPFRA